MPIRSSVACLCLLLAAPWLRAAPGDPDTSFGDMGVATMETGKGMDEAQAMVVQPDGKIVIAGNGVRNSNTLEGQRILLTRVHADGSTDLEFGERGRVMTAAGALPCYANAMALQPDGKIIVGGRVRFEDQTTGFLLARYLPDGALDPEFNGSGLVLTSTGSQGNINSLHLLADGRILAAGTALLDSVPFTHVAVARYRPDGTLDASFGEGGIARQVRNADFTGNAMAVQDNGRIFVAGASQSRMGLCVFLPDGQPDGQFGVNGFIALSAGEDDSANAIAIQHTNSGDRIVLAGTTRMGGNYWLLVARLRDNGRMDRNFDGDGYVGTFPPGLADGDAASILIDYPANEPSRIIVAGRTVDTSNGRRNFTIFKYLDNGALDTSFDGDGIVVTSINDAPSVICAAVARDGLLTVAGTAEWSSYDHDFALVRYHLASGTRDDTFGPQQNGLRTIDLYHLSAEATDVQVQPDGRILIAGSAYTGASAFPVIARMLENGSPDMAFGDAGRTILNAGSSGDATRLLRQPDGRILIAGSIRMSQQTDREFLIARFLPDGKPDPAFGNAGIVRVDVAPGHDAAWTLALDAEGRIVAAGINTGDDQIVRIAVARLLPGGQLDPSFNGSGKVLSSIGSINDQTRDVVVQPDGKIIVCGQGIVNGKPQFSALRYLDNGSLDTGFGAFGRLVQPVGDLAVCFSINLLPDGRFILCGGAVTGGSSDFAMARFHAHGALDTSFGNGGILLTPIGASNDSSLSATLQADGKILAAGFAQLGEDNEPVVARFLPDGQLDASYGLGGRVVINPSPGPNGGVNGIDLDGEGRALITLNHRNALAVARLEAEPVNAAAPAITSIRFSGGNGTGVIHLAGSGAPGVPHTLWSSPTLDSFVPLIPLTPDASGHWQHEDAAAASGRRFYRVTRP